MQLEMTIVDAFTDTVFKGNSAAVIVLDKWIDDALMQSIAMQNKLSETAFLVRQAVQSIEADNTTNRPIPSYHIRWFSPLQEVEFCGHATLASAYLLFDTDSSLSQVQFYAKAVGVLTLTKRDDGKIQMDFPNQKPERITSLPQALIEGLSIKPVEVYQNQKAYFVIYEQPSDVLNVKQDTQVLAKLAPYGVAVTCPIQNKESSNSPYSKYDFISRYFSSAIGGEDPVTGSIHTALAPLWAEKLSKDTLLAYQASSRGGELECEVQGDRVLIAGHAVCYLSGTIEI